MCIHVYIHIYLCASITKGDRHWLSGSQVHNFQEDIYWVRCSHLVWSCWHYWVLWLAQLRSVLATNQSPRLRKIESYKYQQLPRTMQLERVSKGSSFKTACGVSVVGRLLFSRYQEYSRVNKTPISYYCGMKCDFYLLLLSFAVHASNISDKCLLRNFWVPRTQTDMQSNLAESVGQSQRDTNVMR